MNTNIKIALGIISSVFCSNTLATICMYELKEDANVFEVSCIPELGQCYVTGYLSNPNYKNLNGVIAQFINNKSQKNNSSKFKFTINKFFNDSTPIIKPIGYWNAMKTTEKMLSGEIPMNVIYIDANSGKATSPPKLECVKI